MAIGVPNGGTNTAFAGAATSAVPFPTTTTKGTTLILGIALNTGAAGCTTPAGWTLEATLGSTATTLLPTVFVFRKIADGTEGGTTLTVTHASVANRAQIVELAGVDANSPIDVTTGTVDSSAGGQANCVLPSQTTVTPGVTRIAFSASSAATQTATPPAGWTELSDSSGVTATLEVAYIQGVAAGATGTATVVFSGVGKQVGIVLALRPDIVAPTQQEPRRRFVLPFLRRPRSPRSVPVLLSSPQSPPPVARARHAVPLVRIRRRSSQPLPATVVTPPTTQALPPQAQRSRLALPPRRRGRHAAPLAVPQTLPPQQPRVRRTWLLGRLAPTSSVVPIPGVATGPPLLGRARHAAPTRRRGATALPITLPLLTGDASSFEASQGAWTASTGAPTLATSATQHFTGTQSLKATATATGTLAVASPNVFGIVPGSYLRVHAWVYCETNARTLLFQLNWKTAGGGNAGFTSGSTVGGTLGGWTQVTFSGLVPSTPGITGLSLLVLATSVAVSDVFYVDDADVEVVSFTAPSFTPQWWNQVTRRKVQMPPRRGLGTQVPPPGAVVVTTQPLPPQPDTPRTTLLRRRRATFAQPLPVTAPSTVPLLGDTRRAVIPPPILRRLRSVLVVPSALSTPPIVTRARHAAPPLRRRRLLVLPPTRAVQPPPLVMRARHAAPPMRRRVLAFIPFPAPTNNSWLRTVSDFLGLTDFMSVTYTTDGTHSTPTGTTTLPPHTLNPLFEPGQWLYGNATPNRNRRPPLASRKDPPQQ